jgi:hypothetical protein
MDAESFNVGLMQDPGGKLKSLTALFVKILILGLSKVKRNVFWDNVILFRLKFTFLKNTLASFTKADLNPLLLEILDVISNNIIEI